LALQLIPGWRKHIRKAGIFSGGSNFLDKRGHKMLMEIFPEKSNFEK
jgi:hypothetical protein